MEGSVIDLDRDAGAMPVQTWVPDRTEADSPSPAIVLVQEIFGIEQYIVDVAERLAAIGFLVAAPELYWRIEPGFIAAAGAEGLEAAFGLSQQLDVEAAVADVVATIDHVGGLDAVSSVGVLGFCLGGTLAFAAAIEGSPDACVSYYGSGVSELLGGIDRVECPTLFHFGNDDDFIPASHIEAVNDAIDGRAGFVLNVENAGHAFDNHTREMFHHEEAAQVAWAKTMAFLAEHLS